MADSPSDEVSLASTFMYEGGRSRSISPLHADTDEFRGLARSRVSREASEGGSESRAAG